MRKEIEEARRIAAEKAPSMLASKEVKLMLADKLIEETNNAVRKRKKERANWDGTGKKPKDYDKMGLWKLKRDLAAKLKRDYIDSCEADAEAEVVFRWMGQEEKTREEEMSWSIIGEMIDDYAAECIKETFSVSLRAIHPSIHPSSKSFFFCPPSLLCSLLSFLFFFCVLFCFVLFYLLFSSLFLFYSILFFSLLFSSLLLPSFLFYAPHSHSHSHSLSHSHSHSHSRLSRLSWATDQTNHRH